METNGNAPPPRMRRCTCCHCALFILVGSSVLIFGWGICLGMLTNEQLWDWIHNRDRPERDGAKQCGMTRQSRGDLWYDGPTAESVERKVWMAIMYLGGDARVVDPVSDSDSIVRGSVTMSVVVKNHPS